MCGIVGYTGNKDVSSILLKGLKRLEYRGYDSAGIALSRPDSLVIKKKKGMIADLEYESFPSGNTGIGHTRWATHGRPSDKNAHPFYDCEKKIGLVHNGIIDNFVSLKERLLGSGHVFNSDTDSEVIIHLIEENFDGDLTEAVKKTVKELKGSFALCVVMEGSDEIVVARDQSPLVVGVGVEENMVASDVPAILDITNEVKYLRDGDVVRITPHDIKIWDKDDNVVERETKEVSWTMEDAEKGGYEHYMLKEIHEQPRVIHDSLLGRLVDFEDVKFSKYDTSFIRLIACGTSYHAALVGKYIIESMAGIPSFVDMASEFRYAPQSHLSPFTIVISQSGETADTIAAAKEARRRGCRTLAITNVMDSTMTREVDEVVYTQAGPEIGVAATKTFTSQLIVLYLIGLNLGLANGNISKDKAKMYRRELRSLPRHVRVILDMIDDVKEVASVLSEAHDIFFVGRHINFPVALEGALKLKEIAYIHSAGYPAGELKHGPFALLTDKTPVISILVKDHTYEKMLGNIGEMAARDSPIIAVGDKDREVEKLSDYSLFIPKVDPLFSPILVNVILQLLAYYTAYFLGRSIDKPRNLAKSVTVE